MQNVECRIVKPFGALEHKGRVFTGNERWIREKEDYHFPHTDYSHLFIRTTDHRCIGAGVKLKFITQYISKFNNIEENVVEPQLSNIIRTITGNIKPVKIILFGSRARSDYHPESDYDLAIIYDGEKSKREVKLEIRRLFRPPGFSMDLFVLTSKELESQKRIANSLAREITENGIVIYE